MADNRGESDPLEAMTSKIDFKMNLLNDVMADYKEIKQVISGVMKEKESLQQETERLQQENKRQLDDRSLLPLQSLESPNVQTGSMKMKRRLAKRTLGNDADNLEAINEGTRQEVANNPTVGQTSGVQLCDEDDLKTITDELIKGFLEIDYGRRKIGIKKMGQLSEKEFKVACDAKVPHEEVGAAFDELYSSWKQQLGDLSWYPFKSVTFDGNCQEIVNLDDDKLQELKRVWGQDAHNAVVTALLEMKEYDRLSDRSTAYELWNYKEGRKATTKECVQYLFNQVKLLSASKRRNTLRSSGRA